MGVHVFWFLRKLIWMLFSMQYIFQRASSNKWVVSDVFRSLYRAMQGDGCESSWSLDGIPETRRLDECLLHVSTTIPTLYLYLFDKLISYFWFTLPPTSTETVFTCPKRGARWSWRKYSRCWNKPSGSLVYIGSPCQLNSQRTPPTI